jgi:hypothetical protein
MKADLRDLAENSYIILNIENNSFNENETLRDSFMKTTEFNLTVSYF